MPGDGPTQSTREGGVLGLPPGLLPVPSAHQREPGGRGGDESVKHNVLRVEPKKGGARPLGAQAPGACGHGHGHSHGDGAEGGRSPPVGRQSCGAERRAEPRGWARCFLQAWSSFRRQCGGKGEPPGTCTPCRLLVLKFRPPRRWGNAAFFSFSFSLLHVFTDHSVC